MSTININQDYQNRVKHFAALKSKYQAESYQDSSPSSLLYLILRKADLGIIINDLELNWLKENELTETMETISLQQFTKGEIERLKNEFSELKIKYNINRIWETSLNSFLYPLLWKLDTEGNLSDAEIQLLQNNNLSQVVTTAKNIKQFTLLKVKFQATKYQNLYPDDILYPILKKLDLEKSLDESEYDWLLENDFFQTLEIFEKQESEKQAKFTQLKEKYKATKHPDISLSSKLYKILQKLEENKKLNDAEISWLEQQKLNETIDIVKKLEKQQEFIDLTIKYKAESCQDVSFYSKLFNVLEKIDGSVELNEADIQVLIDLNLEETLKIYKDQRAYYLKSQVENGNLLNDLEIDWLEENGYEDIITFAQHKHFTLLKKKYGLIDPNLPIDPFYTIMLQLESKNRLDPLLVVQMIEQNMLSRDGKIAIAHYRLEAEFYEQELKKTGNKWKIPTASSYWRKANEPKKALVLTNIDLGKIRDNQLKSAILVTRGAAFRDMDGLADAESCAKQAMNYQPEAYQPYTLMGAICYDKYEYIKGDEWFEEAIERGAKTEDIDDEIRRVISSNKDEIKRNEAAEYLLKKDPERYAWAKAYLKKEKGKK
ncbi:MAG TPA: hypothetical protein VK184_16715 [Nostocaceae cyanobacterium]|nr:hypothetical protein [Nostocaceae cyanobacterium]